MSPTRRFTLAALAVTLLGVPGLVAAAEGDFEVPGFHFRSGEQIPSLRIHYRTFGRIARDAHGQATNAVLILHGTGGSGRQFLAPQFAGVLFGAGALLDTTRTFVVLPDGIGHGGSSKPSDGLHARFPHYDYDDMVEAQYLLLTRHLGVSHLRLVLGTSMGGMQTWMWGEAHPGFMDALMPLACLPAPIVGRNRLWRSMVVNAIRSDPAWKGGEYLEQPAGALREALDLLTLAGSAPIGMQNALATRDSVERYLARVTRERLGTLDANDLLYQIEASRNYDPSAGLERIEAPLMFVNSADDFINPPELGIAERQIQRVKRGRFVLLPASEQTRGHGTHTWAALWKDHLEELLRASARPESATVTGSSGSR